MDKEPKSYEETSNIPLSWLFSYFHRFLSFCYWSNVYKEYRNKYIISPRFRFNGERIRINGNGNLYIKGRGQMCSNTFIELNGGRLELGDNVVMSKNITIYTNPYDEKAFFIDGEVRSSPSNIKIGNNVFIMPGVFIQGPLEIKDNTIIKPNSVLIGDKR
jgi:acetyltransferase-like isoleucine patch superfamily enzyme